VRVVAALALALLLAGPADAARPLSDGNDPFVWSLQERDIREVVESQSASQNCTVTGETPCVVNPSTECLWSIDDRWTYWAFEGILATGTTSVGDCNIFDTAQKITGLSILSPSPNLDVTITYQTFGQTFTLRPRPSGHVYEYRGCVDGPSQNPASPLIQSIPGSNGGWGTPTRIVVAVTNDTGRAIRKTHATWTFGSSGASPYRESFCIEPRTDWFDVGGGTWRTGI
jgi:hypothetical protein